MEAACQQLGDLGVKSIMTDSTVGIIKSVMAEGLPDLPVQHDPMQATEISQVTK